MISANVNLYDLTCIKKIEDYLQVANGTWFINIQSGDLNLNSNLNEVML
jgi:hypothetical protein